MNITVSGAGYVGLSLAALLAQHNDVTVVDIIPDKVDLINRRISPIRDTYIEKYMSEVPLHLTATLDASEAYTAANFVIVATPTNYDSEKNYFDTSAVESVIQQVTECNPNAVIVIKSTVPVGFTKSIVEKSGNRKILFSPEFLREGNALYDNDYPQALKDYGGDMMLVGINYDTKTKKHTCKIEKYRKLK